MSKEAVLSNYNAIGINVIEMMYSSDYLSIGGLESSRKLALLAQLNASDRVLDIGCGLGGPAMFVAREFGCAVTGIDLADVNVAQATARAQAQALQHRVSFQQGDATNLPLADASFDVVWGQDAWCHVPDKSVLISECARVLSDKGRVVFSDWIETGVMTEERRAQVCDACASTNVQSYAGYIELLEQYGFTLTHDEDISDVFVQQYRNIMQRLAQIEAQMTEKYGAKIYAIVAQKNGDIAAAFEDGLIGGGLFVAHKG
jgi:ubiquinone/menaquinone biosynthesis C-methylase UbiE